MSFPNIIVILIVALLVIGPKKLPDMAKSIGKGYAEFRRAFNDLKKTVDMASADDVTSKSGSRASSRVTKDTYKSRWEEQFISNSVTALSESAEQAPAQSAAEPSPAPVRTKRADLLKEDSDGNNG
ncbi:MAG: twin-arginine translocase TatA/TatE family subunit [Deferribacteraceae bacterium]|jgi:TatA/E family protein of Tat protein translocase|nr:twin-arginine translocase TatA/TatE family subunit [Deferribacteraceae bacterium]